MAAEGSDQSKNLPEVLFKAAWMSVLLGVGMELILIAAAAGFGKSPAFKVVLAELVQKISWSTFVCMGVAVGTAAARMRPAAMGLAGFIAAPIAFNLAKILHKSASAALSVAGPAGGGLSPVLLASMKALEYAALGSLLGWIGSKPGKGLGAQLAIALGVGVVFGGVVLFLTVRQSEAAVPLASLVAKGINEVFFPVGCSIVLFGAQRLGGKTAR